MTQLAKDWLAALGPFAGWMALKGVLWGLVFAFIGLLIALRVMWTLHQRRLLHRDHRIWNIAAKLSYLAVLAAFVAAGGAYGVLSSAQHEMKQTVTAQIQPELSANMPALRARLAEHVGSMASDGAVTVRDLVQPIVKDFQYQPRSDGMYERAKARLINWLVMEAGARALTQAVQQALKMLPEFVQANAAAKEDLTRFSVASLTKVLANEGQNIDFSPLDKTIPEIFSGVLHAQIDSLFKGLYLGVLLNMVLVTALVGVEMLIYFKRETLMRLWRSSAGRG